MYAMVQATFGTTKPVLRYRRRIVLMTGKSTRLSFEQNSWFYSVYSKERVMDVSTGCLASVIL